jgi:tetratricopeptide (TPR) repeat protein/transcriptional regulator with XRE-family HTH domain
VPVAEQGPSAFGGLLRQLRAGAGLTQEELAHAAGVSPRAVSDLERGINQTARKDTARLLADALHLTGPARASFESAARGHPPGSGLPIVAGGVAATHALPRDNTSFTGRQAELHELVDAAAGAADRAAVVGILSIGGMAGVGKTAFAVHVAHVLAPRFPDGQTFLPLHGHTPGQRPVDPADALASLLLTAGVPATQIPPGLASRTALWRDRLAGKQLLLVLDDAVGSEQVQPLLPSTPGSFVLITSRRHLTALEDARAVSLDTLPPAEAAELLVRLATRPGLSPQDGPVTQLTRLCGYLPLAIGMLARQLHHHPAWSAGGLAAELAEARDRLELMATENVSVAAAFDLSYADLTAGQQHLFRCLGLHPGTDIDAYAAASLSGTGLAEARRGLMALYDQYLLTEPAYGRYRIHDLIREHARALAAASADGEQEAAAGRLLDYYAHTASAAGRHLPRRTSTPMPAPAGDPPALAPDLPARADAVAWFDAERLNLHASADHAAASDRPQHAVIIAAAMHSYLRRYGHWDQARKLHEAALRAARQAGDRAAEAGALTDLGDMQGMTEDYPAAVASLTQARDRYRDLGERLGEASALSHLGYAQYVSDDYPAATDSLSQALALYRRLADRPGEASVLSDLGAVQSLTDDYPAAVASLSRALALQRELGNPLGEASALNHLGAVQQAMGDYPAAVASLSRALALHRELGTRLGQANALNYLGAVQQAMGDYPAAAASLTQALGLYRSLGDRLGEAGALDDLGAVQSLSCDYAAATASITHALDLYTEIDNRPGQAEALNNLGELLLASDTAGGARARHEHALAIATEIGATSEEGRALEGIGRSHLREGDPAEAAAPLRRALAIYQRIGSPRVVRVQAMLDADSL